MYVDNNASLSVTLPCVVAISSIWQQIDMYLITTHLKTQSYNTYIHTYIHTTSQGVVSKFGIYE